MDLISIIVPVYNVEQYISRCIDSLLSQSYKNLEILLIDDGSTDSSGNICDEYANKYNNVHVYHKKNGGLSSARNLGLEKINVRSRYVGFVDSDDFVHPNMYKVLYDNLIESDSDISVCNFEKVYDDNYPLEVINNVSVVNSINLIENYFDHLEICTIVCNKLYKRECIDGIKFELGRIYEDQIYSPQVIYKSKKIALTDAKLYYYYQRKDSISHGGHNVDGWEDLFYAAEYYIRFGKQIKNKEFIEKSTEYYIGSLLCRTIQSYNEGKGEYYKWKRMYGAALKKYVFGIRNYKARMIYLLYYISPKLYQLIN